MLTSRHRDDWSWILRQNGSILDAREASISAPRDDGLAYPSLDTMRQWSLRLKEWAKANIGSGPGKLAKCVAGPPWCTSLPAPLHPSLLLCIPLCTQFRQMQKKLLETAMVDVGSKHAELKGLTLNALLKLMDTPGVKSPWTKCFKNLG